MAVSIRPRFLHLPPQHYGFQPQPNMQPQPNIVKIRRPVDKFCARGIADVSRHPRLDLRKPLLDAT